MSGSAAVIGFGSIGRYHSDLVGQRYDNIAIVDFDPEARNTASVLHPTAMIAGSLDELDHRGWEWDQSLGIIASWGPDHASTFFDLVSRGVKRILCEKPLANSISLAAEMVDVACGDSVTLGIHHHRRYSGLVTGMRSLANKLAIGDPQAVYITGGASGLVTNGIHHIDWIVELFGEWPELVISTARGEKINPRSTELQFYGGTAAWMFPSGREATISFSNRSSVSPKIIIYYRDAIAELVNNSEIEINLRDEASIKKHALVTRTGVARVLGQRGQIPGVLKLEEATSRLLDEIDLDRVKVFTPYDAQLALGACIGALTSGLTHSAIRLPIDPESEDGTREWPIS